MPKLSHVAIVNDLYQIPSMVCMRMSKANEFDASLANDVKNVSAPTSSGRMRIDDTYCVVRELNHDGLTYSRFIESDTQ